MTVRNVLEWFLDLEIEQISKFIFVMICVKLVMRYLPYFIVWVRRP